MKLIYLPPVDIQDEIIRLRLSSNMRNSLEYKLDLRNSIKYTLDLRKSI